MPDARTAGGVSDVWSIRADDRKACDLRKAILPKKNVVRSWRQPLIIAQTVAAFRGGVRRLQARPQSRFTSGPGTSRTRTA